LKHRRIRRAEKVLKANAFPGFSPLPLYWYAAAPTVELLPRALGVFQKAFPHVNVVLHDTSRNETVEGLQKGLLYLAVTLQAAELQSHGIDFEMMKTYPLCVALHPGHPLSRLKTIPLAKVAAEPLVTLRRSESPLRPFRIIAVKSGKYSQADGVTAAGRSHEDKSWDLKHILINQKLSDGTSDQVV